MCGITGFYGFEDKELLRKMTSLLEHRGPDQFGYYTDNKVCLGHRRLSIIDLSEDGKQPMGNEDESVWVVFNGEIYNYKELKRILEEKGHKFKSKTDTEVIVHAYEEYGEDCVKHFNGCFAFAIYDSEKKSIFLARDRMGIKPLYYTQVEDHFYFASEIKSILASSEIKRKVNIQALDYYLSFYANPLAETMFKRIFKLLPGYSATYKDGKLNIKKYWDLEMEPAKQQNPEKDLLNLLSDSVKKRLMSDVPLGVYLSGGVDSGSMVALMSKLSDKVKTFSVGFDADTEKAELKRAKILAEHFNTEHQEVLVGIDSIKHLPKIVWHQDEPMGDPTSIPTYLLSKEAKKKCTVILTGEGADEQFAGYEQQKFMMLHQKYLQKIPLWLRKSAAYPIKKIPAKNLNLFFKYMGALGEEGKRRVSEFATSEDTADQLLSIISIFSEKEKEELASGALLSEVINRKVSSQLNKDFFSDKKELLNQLLMFENKTMLAENLLMKVDKNTMAHGIEARVPFLDHRVVEYAAKLPEKMKLNGMKDKDILRQTMKPHLPDNRSSQKKERFFVPIDYWLKNELSTLSEELLSKRAIKRQKLFDYNYVEKALANYKKSPLFYGRQLWTLLNYQLWHKTFMEEEDVRL